MIKTIALGVGGLAAIGVFAYATRKWWLPLVYGSEREDEQSLTDIPQFEIEPIDRLSYEYIIKLVEKVMQSDETKGKLNGNAKLMVMPNIIALDYYIFTKSKGQPFFTKKELTEDEKSKMIVVLITTSDNLKDSVWGKIFVPNELSDDFHDFIPNDKLYMRPIEKETSVDAEENILEKLAVSDINLQYEQYGVSHNVEKERTQILSYEWILNEALKILQDKNFNKDDNKDYSLMIMPNKLACECYDYCEKSGKKLLNEDLADDEKKKMVIVLITTEDNKNVLWGKILIPDELSDDFSDFVSNDKIYKKSIKID